MSSVGRPLVLVACSNSYVGVPVKFGDTQATIRRRPPLLGEHTEEILGEIGITAEAIDALRQTRVI